MNNLLEKFKNALISIGFKSDDAEKQMNELEEIARTSLLIRLAKDHPESADEIGSNPNGYISKLSKEELTEVANNVAREVVEQYVESVARSLSEEEKIAFTKMIFS